MKVNEWIEGAKQKVSALDAELIAARAFAPRDADRSWLAAHGEDEVSERGLDLAEQFLAKRAEGVPLAYLFREKEFYGRDFRVTPEVLVPRAETETLIELVKELDLPAQAQILEIGTGSGCIAVTLACELPQSRVLATDVSEGALLVARANDELYEGRADFAQGDLLEAVPEDFSEYDVVVANLPYVDRNWDWLDHKSLSYEPEEALYAEDGGLAMYKRLIRELKARGADFTKYVVLEADPSQHEQLIQFAEENGLKLVKTQGFGLVFVTVKG